MIIGNMYESTVYINPIKTIDSYEYEEVGLIYEFEPVQYSNIKREFINICVICEDCKIILDTLINTRDNKSRCTICKGEKLHYLSTELTDKYKYRVNRKISDAEFLTLLLQKI